MYANRPNGAEKSARVFHLYLSEHRHQLSFEDFFLPFGGKPSGDNRWIRLYELIPSDELEDDSRCSSARALERPPSNSEASWHSVIGPRLGRPTQERSCIASWDKKQFIDDQRQRNAVEGKIGPGKRRYGFGLVQEKLAATQGSVTALNVMVMNLEKLLVPCL
jgi:hypothetical protein